MIAVALCWAANAAWAALGWLWWAAGWACNVVGAMVLCGKAHALADRVAAWAARRAG